MPLTRFTHFLEQIRKQRVLSLSIKDAPSGTPADFPAFVQLAQNFRAKIQALDLSGENLSYMAVFIYAHALFGYAARMTNGNAQHLADCMNRLHAITELAMTAANLITEHDLRAAIVIDSVNLWTYTRLWKEQTR